MKLTKQQRHTAYIIMLVEAEAKPNPYLHRGFCAMIFKEFGIGVAFDTSFYLWFPELYKRKPQGWKLFWFPRNKDGWQQRIALLKQCIEETA